MNIESVTDLKQSRRQRAASSPRLDRLPPHSTEAEMGTLGCCLLEPTTCLNEVALTLPKKEAFYDLRHQTIYEHMVQMADQQLPTDLISLQQFLKDRQLLDQVGGLPYLNQLQDAVPSAANLSYYLDTVKIKYTLRRLITTCTSVVDKVYNYEGEAEKILDEVERDILAIRPAQHKTTSLKALMGQAAAVIEWKAMNWDKISGMSTGLPDLDRQTDGMHNGEFIVLAAFPSCGKSALGLNIAVFNALAGEPVAVLTAEMRPLQLVIRSLCADARVNFRRLTEACIPKLVTATHRISRSPLHLESINGFTIGQVLALARRMKQQHGIKLFVIDYIQLIAGEGDNREQQVASVSRGMKNMALEHDCPILGLCQLNDDGKLRESRAIGMDGDSVWKVSNEEETGWQPDIQPVIINIEKSRDGETGPVKAIFIKTSTRFESATSPHSEPEPITNEQEER